MRRTSHKDKTLYVQLTYARSKVVCISCFLLADWLRNWWSYKKTIMVLIERWSWKHITFCLSMLQYRVLLSLEFFLSINACYYLSAHINQTRKLGKCMYLQEIIQNSRLLAKLFKVLVYHVKTRKFLKIYAIVVYKCRTTVLEKRGTCRKRMEYRYLFPSSYLMKFLTIQK